MYRSVKILQEGIRDGKALLKPGNACRGIAPSLPPEGATRAVLLVPGLFGQGAAMQLLANACMKSNLPACIFHVGLWSFMPYGLTLDRLVGRIQRIRRERPTLTQLDLIAHSMGGLLALDAIGSGVLNRLRVRMVTLGTMFQGTPSAVSAAFALSAWEMHPARDRFRRDFPFQMDDVPLLCVDGDSDKMVPRGTSLHRLLRHAHHLQVNASHRGLLRNRQAREGIIRFLSSDIQHNPLATS